MSQKLPPELLGILSPILSLVEQFDMYSLPHHWVEDPQQFSSSGTLKKERERGWILRELSTASLDTVGGVIRSARGSPKTAYRRKEAVLEPPADYEITEALNRLANYFFDWVGNELVVREGRLAELHAVSRRFPVSNIIRFAYAVTAAHNHLHEELTLDRPTRLGFISTNYHSLRVEISKGVWEGHLHLSSLLSPEESWIEDVFSSPWPGNATLTKAEKRLTHMGRMCIGVLSMTLGYFWLRNHDCDFYKIQKQGPFLCAQCQKEALIKGVELVPTDPIDPKCKTYHEYDFYLCENCCHKSYAGDSRTHYRHQKVEHFPWATIEALMFSLDRLYQTTDEMSFLELNRHITALFREERENLCLNFHLSPKSPPDWILELLSKSTRIISSSVAYREELMNEFQMFLFSSLISGREQLTGHLMDPFDKPEHRLKQKFRKSPRLEKSRKLLLCLERLCFRYLVLQTHHWHRLTLHGRTTGLDYFENRRTTGHRWKAAREEYLRLALKHSCESQSIKGLEGRISPPESARDLKPWILNMTDQYLKQNLEQFGLVVHFKKLVQRRHTTESPLNSRVRHGDVRRLTRSKALRLFRVFGSGNSLVPFVVGIDAASLELSAPPEVFAPAFRFLRDLPIEAVSRDIYHVRDPMSDELNNIFQKRRLNVTYHVGEDFRHILSGLRAIVEAVMFLDLQPGDRLGHALALGINAKKWLEQIGHQATMPKQEWLDNLVWLHHLLDDLTEFRKLELEDEIQALSRDIYKTADFDSAGQSGGKQLLELTDQIIKIQETIKEQCPNVDFEDLSKRLERKEIKSWDRDWPIPTLYDAWRLRQLDPYCSDVNALMEYQFKLSQPSGWGREHRRWHLVQQKLYYQINRKIGSNAAFRLLAMYWYDQKSKRRGDDFIHIDMNQKRTIWLDLIRCAQKKVQNFLRQRQIVIEACPSSNVLIGPIEGLENHQIFELTLDDDWDLRHELKVTVNTDNPGMLGTSLDHEYYLLAETLIKQGVPELKVLRWLSWLRQNGRDCSFLRSAPDPKVLKPFFERNRDAYHRSSGKGVAFHTQHWAEKEMSRLKASRKNKLAQLEALDGTSLVKKLLTLSESEQHAFAEFLNQSSDT